MHNLLPLCCAPATAGGSVQTCQGASQPPACLFRDWSVCRLRGGNKSPWPEQAAVLLVYQGSSAAEGDDCCCSDDGGQSHSSVAALQHAADSACQGVLQALMLCHIGSVHPSKPRSSLWAALALHPCVGWQDPARYRRAGKAGGDATSSALLQTFVNILLMGWRENTLKSYFTKFGG